MSRRSFFLTLTCFVLGLAVLGTVLVLLLRFECRWYAQAALPPSPLRRKSSEEFCKGVFDFINEAYGDRRYWDAKFTDVQLNSYLEEGLVHSGFDAHLLPEGISQPRVIFDTDRIHLAFRYGSGLLSTVISIDLRVWLVKKEQNVVALELEGFRAGAVPISAKSLLEKVAEVGRQNGIAVNWYRYKDNGHPVALLRFQDDLPHYTMLLESVKVTPGTITFSGRSSDEAVPTPHAPQLPAEVSPKPAGS